MIRGKITVVEGNTGNPTVAAAALPPVSAGNTAEAVEVEENYDSDPFAELFGTAASQDAKPQSSPVASEPNSEPEEEFLAGGFCPCCAPQVNGQWGIERLLSGDERYEAWQGSSL